MARRMDLVKTMEGENRRIKIHAGGIYNEGGNAMFTSNT